MEAFHQTKKTNKHIIIYIYTSCPNIFPREIGFLTVNHPKIQSRLPGGSVMFGEDGSLEKALNLAPSKPSLEEIRVSEGRGFLNSWGEVFDGWS